MGRVTLGLLAGVLALSGCGPAGTPSASHGPARLTTVTVAMGYFANVQFAPFYVAVQKGYYRAAGLDVHFQYGIEPEALRLASAGKVDFVNSGGDEVLTAGARGLRVRYVLTQYSRFPTAIFSLRQTHIRRPSELRGHTVGVPGRYGASYVGLLAVLQRAHVSGVRIQSIGFNQVDAVAHHKVDAAVGYAMNEPVELRLQGYSVDEIDAYHLANIAGAGIAASDDEIAKHPAVVRAFVLATVRGMTDTLRNPEAALRASEDQVKEIKVEARTARATLYRSLDFWRPEAGHPLGWTDPRIWDQTARLLFEFGQIPRRVSPTPFYTNSFLLRS